MVGRPFKFKTFSKIAISKGVPLPIELSNLMTIKLYYYCGILFIY